MFKSYILDNFIKWHFSRLYNRTQTPLMWNLEFAGCPHALCVSAAQELSKLGLKRKFNTNRSLEHWVLKILLIMHIIIRLLGHCYVSQLLCNRAMWCNLTTVGINNSVSKKVFTCTSVVYLQWVRNIHDLFLTNMV